MQATIEKQPQTFVWNGPGALSPDYLVTQYQVDPFPERWQLKPLKIAIYPESVIENSNRNVLVTSAVKKLLDRLIRYDFENQIVEMPPEYWDKRDFRRLSSLNGEIDLPNVVIRPGTSELDLILDPMDYGKLPDPKPLFFYVSAVNKLPPEAETFEFARGQLVKAAAQNGIIFEIDQNTQEISGFLWMSMQGNHRILRGKEKGLLDSAALRFSVHNGDTFVTERSDYPNFYGDPIITWEEWSQNAVHHDLHEMTQLLYPDYLEDHVDLTRYTPEEPKHGQRISDAINRSDLGEGMFSTIIGRIVAMSPSGGRKVNWSEDPDNFHLTPLSHITTTGTVVYIPKGAPENTRYKNGSVEARENLDAYIMRQRYSMGAVDNLADYERWQRDELEKHSMIPVYQEGAPHENFTIVHLHGMPDQYDAKKVEVVEPDYQLYPQVDMACGTRGGNGSLRSALAKSKWFTSAYDPDKHFLDDRSIVVLLRGHGIVMLAKNPQEIIRAIENDMEFSRPAKLMV